MKKHPLKSVGIRAFLLLAVSGVLIVGLTGCQINIPPTAVIVDTVNSQTGTVTFDLSQSNDPDGSIVSYEFYPRSVADPDAVITEDEEAMTEGGWDSITETPGQGQYKAKLVVYDDGGESDTRTEDYIID